MDPMAMLMQMMGKSDPDDGLEVDRAWLSQTFPKKGIKLSGKIANTIYAVCLPEDDAAGFREFTRAVGTFPSKDKSCSREAWLRHFESILEKCLNLVRNALKEFDAPAKEVREDEPF